MLKGISEQARDALIKMFQLNKIQDPVVTFATGVVFDSEKSSIGVGVYEKEKLFKDEELITINEIEFYFDPSIKDQIKGKLLDIDGNGNFYLV